MLKSFAFVAFAVLELILAANQSLVRSKRIATRVCGVPNRSFGLVIGGDVVQRGAYPW